MRWSFSLTTLRACYTEDLLLRRGEKEHQRASARFLKMQLPPPSSSSSSSSSPLSHSLSSSLALTWLLRYQTAHWPRAVEWQADGPNRRADCVPKWRRQPPSVLLPSFLPSGPGPEPTSWEHGAGRLQPTALWEWHNERVHRKSRVRVWLGEEMMLPMSFWQCTRPDVLASIMPEVESGAPLILLSITIFSPDDLWQYKKTPSSLFQCYCSFGVHMRVS